jgi:hypothetical protein
VLALIVTRGILYATLSYAAIFLFLPSMDEDEYRGRIRTFIRLLGSMGYCPQQIMNILDLYD